MNTNRQANPKAGTDAPNAKRIAIITGATSGVGLEFTRQLDAGAGGSLDELWLIARSKDHLAQVAASCEHPTRVFSLDLSQTSSVPVFEAVLNEAAMQSKLQVAWLVNSAGYGRFGKVQDIGRQDNLGMIRLNCLALVDMCLAVLPHMDAGSRIVNLASVAGLMPQPELSVYCASKSFVFGFTRTLDYELRGTDVHAMALCPKFMDTRFLDNAGDGQAVRRMTSIGFEEVERVVRQAIKTAIKGRAVCITAPDMRAAYALTKLLPAAATLRLHDLLFTLRRGPSAR